MSFDEPLEVDLQPDESSYTLDGTTRIYLVDAIVRERTHDTFGKQYAVRYRNGQHQWWMDSDLQENYLNELLKFLNDSEDKNENALAKIQSQDNLNRVSPSFSKTPTPPSSVADAQERKLRPRRRCSSQYDEKNDSIPEPVTPVLIGGNRNKLAMTSSTSSHGTSASCKKRRLITGSASKGGSTSQLDIKNETEGSIHENEEDSSKSLLLALAIPDVIRNSENGNGTEPEEPDLLQNLKESLSKATAEIANRFVGPLLEDIKTEQAAFVKLKSSYDTVVMEKKELKDWLTGLQVDMEILRQQCDEKVEERNTKIANLEMEVETLKAEHLRSLREIVGKGNYQDTDDETTLTKNALQRSQELDSFLCLAQAVANRSQNHQVGAITESEAKKNA